MSSPGRGRRRNIGHHPVPSEGPGPDDRHIRVWTITDHGGGTFLAEPAASFQ